MRPANIHNLLVCGAPTSGKDTLSEALVRKGPFRTLKKVKDSVSGCRRGYHIITPGEFDELIKHGEMVQWHSRYGRRYGILWSEVFTGLQENLVNIIHVGPFPNLSTLQTQLGTYKNVSVLLHIPRAVAERRLWHRHGDTAEVTKRLDAYDEEYQDYAKHRNRQKFDLIFDNSGTSVNVAADTLIERLAEIGDELG